MKSIIKIFCFAVILFSLNKNSNAQARDYFHSFHTVINIPIVVDYKKVFQNKENVTERHIPDKQISIAFYIKVDDLRFEGNKFFSGMSMIKYSDNDDIKTFYGEFSEDKKTIKYIELTRCFTEYSSVNRENAYPVKTINISIRIENIPLYLGRYQFKHAKSKITKVEYKSRYFMKYKYDRSDTRTEDFVKINYEKITTYSTPIYVSFKRGKLKLNNKTNKKVAVIVQHNENKDEWGGIMKGIGALIISDLMKIPGLIVLERINIKELKGEIDLSQSGLVNPETKVRGDRMMTPDIELIVSQENRIPEDMNIMFESFAVRTKIRIVETGQVIDANLVLNINMKKIKLFWEDWSEYIRNVISFLNNFLYE